VTLGATTQGCPYNFGMPILYLVGTPIGNLEDISPRALNVLRSVSLIAAEDTRTARQLLTHYDIHTPVTSYYEHNKLSKLDRILDALQYGDVAVISEAGMPGLSDPGYELVRAALRQNARVSPVPGPSAVLAALVASGIAADKFFYLGFLPREPQARRKLLRQVARESLKPQRRLPVITTLHGTDITLVGADRSYLPITRYGIVQSDGVTAISNYLKKATAETFQFDDIAVIPNFICASDYQRHQVPELRASLKK